MAEQAPPERLGRYEIVRELGRGAMGVVYEGRDPNIGRRVAIKTARRDLLAASGMADELMKRFLREAQAAGALNHPNIITIFDADEEAGVAYIAMEYLDGGDLRRLIEDRCSLSMERIADIGATICEALAAAHDQGIVHRDVKPANIIMLPNGHLKVADFGIAHVSDSNLTQDGAMIGTPHYMSPEQFMGQKTDGRSDLFSVGIIVYELLTGEKPFNGESVAAVMQRTMKADPIPPAELNYAVPDALNDVVLKSLGKRPQHRYQNGRALAAALRESVKAQPDPAVLALQALPEADGASTVLTRPAAGPDTSTVLSRTTPAAGGQSATLLSTSPPPGVPAAETISTRSRKTSTAVAGGLAGVLVLLAVGLGIFRGQRDGDPVALPGGPSKVSVEVYYSESPEVSADLQAVSGTENAQDRFAAAEQAEDAAKRIVRLKAAQITIRDAASGREIGRAETDDIGQAQVPVSASPEKVTFEVAGAVEGHTILPIKQDLAGPDHWGKAQFFVLYAKRQ